MYLFIIHVRLHRNRADIQCEIYCTCWLLYTKHSRRSRSFVLHKRISCVCSLPNATIRSHLLWENVLPFDKLSQSDRVCSAKRIIAATKYSFFVEEIQFRLYRLILFFVISHNEIDGSWLNQWKIQAKWKQKKIYLLFVRVFIESHINRQAVFVSKKFWPFPSALKSRKEFFRI